MVGIAPGTSLLWVENDVSGAELVAGPVETPWHSLNSRLEAPAGLQITIFEQLEPE